MNTLADSNLGSTTGMNRKKCIRTVSQFVFTWQPLMMKLLPQPPPSMAQSLSEEDIEVTIVLDCILYE